MGNDSIGRLNALASKGPSIFARYARYIHPSNFVIELEFMLLGSSETKQSGRVGSCYVASIFPRFALRYGVIYKRQNAIKNSMLRFIDFSRSNNLRRGVPRIVIEIHGGQK